MKNFDQIDTRSELPSVLGFRPSIGTSSSQLRLPIQDPLTMQLQPLGESVTLLDGTPVVFSSSGRSYTLTELCTCTDFSNLVSGQISMFSAVYSGENSSTDTVDPMCQKCSLVRPSRITSLSMSAKTLPNGSWSR